MHLITFEFNQFISVLTFNFIDLRKDSSKNYFQDNSRKYHVSIDYLIRITIFDK